MHPYPHVYRVDAAGNTAGTVAVTSGALPGLTTAPPPEFDGPEGLWSPETLLVGAIADCFILTFRGVARAAGFAWQDLSCTVEGTLERPAGGAQFTRYLTRARLTVPAGTDEAKARGLLERAEQVCLVANSLKGERHIEAEIITAP